MIDDKLEEMRAQLAKLQEDIEDRLKALPGLLGDLQKFDYFKIPHQGTREFQKITPIRNWSDESRGCYAEINAVLKHHDCSFAIELDGHDGELILFPNQIGLEI